MNWSGAARTAAACAILIVLNFTLRPLLAWRSSVDFLLVALVFGSVRIRPAGAAVYGLMLGLAADSLSLGAFGAGALASTVVGYASSWLKALFFADNIALTAMFLFAGKWVFDVVFILVAGRVKGIELLTQLVLWTPLAAGVTAVAGVVAIVLLRPLYSQRAT